MRILAVSVVQSDDLPIAVISAVLCYCDSPPMRIGVRVERCAGRFRADELFTERRLRIVDHLKQEQPHSVRELARDLNEDKGVISRDLEALAQLDLIEYVEESRAKAPRLKHSHVVVEPVV